MTDRVHDAAEADAWSTLALTQVQSYRASLKDISTWVRIGAAPQLRSAPW